MRDATRAAFVDFSAPLEGVVPYLYLDIKGLVTTAIGVLVDPLPHAISLPWVTKEGVPATRQEIAADWMRVKTSTYLAKQGHRAAARVANLRLTPEGVAEAVLGKLAIFDAALAKRFDAYEEWPADAQLFALSISWACGPAFRFDALAASLKLGDFEQAALECTISEQGNPGLIPRNKANRILLRNAARVVSFGLDPDKLHWPLDLATIEQDAISTEPEIPNPASSPTIYVSGPPCPESDPEE